MELRFTEVKTQLMSPHITITDGVIMGCICVDSCSGAGVPVCQHAAGQRLAPAGGAGGSFGRHRAEFRGTGRRDGAAFGPRPHPATAHHLLRPDGAAVQRQAQPALC